MLRSLLVTLLIPVAVQAQLTRTSETIDVNVVEVDVVVLDANGAPVPGLRASDFDLRVGGHKRPITNFYEVNRRAEEARPGNPAASSSVARRDYIVLFIDELHINQREKKRALDALRTFVMQHVHAGTAAMLVASDGDVRILKRFTEDPSGLTRAIDALQQRPAHVTEYESDRRQILDLIDTAKREVKEKGESQLCETLPGMIESLAQEGQASTERTIAALNRVADMSSGLDGRRVLVYVSDGLPLQPGAETFDYYHPDELAPNGSSLAAFRALTEAMPLDSMSHNLSTSFQHLAKQTALAGVQFFAIDAHGVQGFDEGLEAQASSSRLDSSLIRSNLLGPIQMLADETGGQAIIDENDMNIAFAKLDDHLASYYSLGFVSEGTDTDEAIGVGVKRRGLTVRAARHVRQRTAREQIADRVRASLYARIEDNPLGADVSIAPLTGRNGLKAVVSVPISRLSILPQNTGYGTSFSVFVAMMDDQMREAAPRMFVHRVTAAETQQSVQTLSIDVPPGRYTVSMAIADSYSSTVSYLQREITIGR